MKNQSTPEQEWVEQTLHSLDGAARPTPSPWLYQQVRHRLEARQAARADAPDWGWTLKRLAFASALVAANLATFAYRADLPTAQTATPAVTEYGYPTLGGY